MVERLVLRERRADAEVRHAEDARVRGLDDLVRPRLPRHLPPRREGARLVLVGLTLHSVMHDESHTDSIMRHNEQKIK